MSAPVNRWFILVLVCVAQFMVVLDATIVNVALPSIQVSLDFSPASLQWVVNAYTLVFGGFLLLGGRAGDLFGRQRLFMAGVALFTLASLVNGIATSSGMLIAGRAAQGLGAALVSPAALSIVTTTFAEGRERTKALGVWSAIAAGGGAVGLILGGVLTDALSWRWVFFVNLPIGIAAFVLAARYIPNTKAENRPETIDAAGAVTVTAGLLVLVYDIVKAQEYGWTSGRTLGIFALALVLLGSFVIIELRSKAPLIRLGIFRFRALTTANIAMLLVISGLYGMFYFASIYVQEILGYSPIQAGFAFVPVTVGIVIGAALAQPLVARFGTRTVPVAGIVLAATGLLLLSRIPTHGTLPRRPAPRPRRDVDRDGPDVRADHAARDDRRPAGGRGARIGDLQHLAAGRRRARPRDPVVARGREDGDVDRAGHRPRGGARRRLPARVPRRRRAHARGRGRDPHHAPAPPRPGARRRTRRSRWFRSDGRRGAPPPRGRAAQPGTDPRGGPRRLRRGRPGGERRRRRRAGRGRHGDDLPALPDEGRPRRGDARARARVGRRLRARGGRDRTIRAPRSASSWRRRCRRSSRIAASARRSAASSTHGRGCRSSSSR